MEYFIASDNTKIYYKSSGKGNPIIFVHGFAATYDVFRIPGKVLGKSYNTISYDLRGHGLSNEEDKEVNLERLALDLKELIDYLELNSVKLVGWSLGGSIILEYIKQFKTSKLSKVCLIDISPKIVNDKEWKLGLYHGNYSIEDSIKDLDLIKKDWLRFSNDFIKTMSLNLNESSLDIALLKIRDNSPLVMASIWASLIQKDYRNILSTIDIPTLIIFGEESTLYSREAGKYMNENIIDSKFEVFEGCTHLLVLENPIKLNRVLDSFFK